MDVWLSTGAIIDVPIIFMKKTILPFGMIFMLFPTLASAHLVFAEQADGGFVSGLTHPVLGFDHLLAMFSVGVLSAQMGGRAIWSVPLAFVAVMLLGGLLGIQGVPLFSVELGIALSVLALGLAIAIEKKLPSVVAMLCVGLFALFHGYAHGAEMPNLAQPGFYVLGFIIGTAVIHIAGVFLGVFAEKFKRGDIFLRYLGAVIAGIGFQLIIV